MIFEFLVPPHGPRVQDQKCSVARPIRVSNSHAKFGWILSNGLGGDSVRRDRRERLQYPHHFLKKRGDKNVFLSKRT